MLSVAAPTSAHLDSGARASHPASADGKPVRFHYHRARVLLHRGFALERWSIGPDRDALDAARAHKRAILVDTTRFAIHQLRLKLSQRFDAYRQHRLEVTPFAGPSGTYWAVPYGIVACESGGDFGARNSSSTAGGAYQILNTTWWANGGTHYSDSHPAAVAPPDEQHEVAHRVWVTSGAQAWSCSG